MYTMRGTYNPGMRDTTDRSRDRRTGGKLSRACPRSPMQQSTKRTAMQARYTEQHGGVVQEEPACHRDRAAYRRAEHRRASWKATTKTHG